MTPSERLSAIIRKKIFSFNEWLNHSLYQRLTFAMIALTLSILLIFGLLSYGFTRHLVRQNIQKEFESNSVQAAQRLEHAINELIASISTLSTNLLVTNAIVDTFGRDAYIIPFIKGYKSEHNIAIELTLSDFMGKPIASNGSNPDTFNSAKLLTTIIEEGKRFSKLEDGDNGKTLLIAFPVIWAMTNQAEGMLVAKVNLDELFQKTLRSFVIKPDQRMVLINGGTKTLQTSPRDDASSFRMRVPLKLYSPLDQMAFQLEIYDYRKIQARWLAGIYLIAGLLAIVVTMRVSKAISLMVLGRLMVVSNAAKRISETGSLDLAPEVGGADEVTTLRSAFNAMVGKVRERTTQLETATEELHKANSQLAVELEELRLVQEELGRSNIELEQFAYIASHDLQEPMRMVVNFTQLLGERYQGKLDNAADEFIGFAVEGATRMQLLLKGLVAYSRVGTRGKPLGPIDCNSILSKTLANLWPLIEENGAVIINNSLPLVQGDEIQLIQLFQNLLANAIKFRAQEAPEIRVSAERKDAEWIFSIQDNGIGIAPEHQERIFLIFQRLHKLADYPGTGIGLALCKKIVQRHAGRIWVESTLGQGSTFCFALKGAGENSAN